jgi:hypothetical protein
MGHHFRVLAEDSQRAGRTFAGLGEREIPGIRFEVTPPITMVIDLSKYRLDVRGRSRHASGYRILVFTDPFQERLRVSFMVADQSSFGTIPTDG